ncbi:DUF815 domain-containing protein, partial [bacterium]|nr:DUF815 domain-containing protein [bacterium]
MLRRAVSAFLLCFAVFLASGVETAELLGDAGAESGKTEVRKPETPEKKDQTVSDIDRILSGQEALPVLNEEKIAENMHERFAKMRRWLDREKDALLTFLIASGISILIGAGLAFGIRRLISYNDAQKRKMRWQFIAALSGPLILMVVSGVIFLFLLPVLHSLPELYPLDARLFFTCATAIAAWAGLRLIEVKKNELFRIPYLVEELSANPLKFVLFIDDLSFSSNDDNFSALKAILEGSVSTCGKNIAIYATSNRRHLVKETMGDRAGDELHVNDTLQETMSLAARFGLTITYQRPDKEEYLAIVKNLAREYGLDVPEKELFRKAEAHALRCGGRSPRVA